VDDLNFSRLSIKPEILKNLSILGYKQMTAIQDKSLAHILNNKDVTAQSKTGSGKTVAFAIGILSKIDTSKRGIQALVICPTRELSEQVAKEIRKLARLIPNVKVLNLSGGTPMFPQIVSLEHGAHCIVGTPGRIQDHLSRKTLRLNRVNALVLDEADRMLDMGFSEVLNYIVGFLPDNRQTLLFSATYPDNIKSLSSKLQKDPIYIKAQENNQNNDIEQLFFKTKEEDKHLLLNSLLNYYRPASTIIFCNTKLKCQSLVKDLQNKGFYAQAIHGDLEQRERDLALLLFANKSNSILVATDVAARGIDIKDLDAVINFELSRDPQVHIHRIGRTGRAGNKGLAISLYSEKEKISLKNIEEIQDKRVISEEQSFLNKSQSRAKIVPEMASLMISGGKKNKLRPADILGSLTCDSKMTREDVGKIDIFNFYSYVAIKKTKFNLGLDILSKGKTKGRNLKVRKI
jgi:ATP-dependent RNA helicase DbpA